MNSVTLVIRAKDGLRCLLPFIKLCAELQFDMKKMPSFA